MILYSLCRGEPPRRTGHNAGQKEERHGARITLYCKERGQLLLLAHCDPGSHHLTMWPKVPCSRKSPPILLPG